MIKFFIDLIRNYKIKFFLILFYELKNFILYYKVFQINLIKNERFTDNIPIPFMFLEKLKLFVKAEKKKKIIDLGCGSGRFIFYILKKFPDSEIHGVELNYEIFRNTKKLFINNKKVFIKNTNILHIDKYYKDKKFNIIFLNSPFKYKKDYYKLFKKFRKLANKNALFILINIQFKLKMPKKFGLIYYYNIGNRSINIYRINT